MTDDAMTADICVIGAGIIGITAARELQSRGVDVALVDRGSAGRATSYGNAGVLSASTVLTVNNPLLLRNLPAVVFRRVPYVTYDFWYALSRAGWLLRFFRSGMSKHTERTAAALHALQQLSLRRHRAYIHDAKADTLLQEQGWLKVYRDRDAYRQTELERNLMDSFGIEYTELTRDDIADLEPGLKAAYETGLLLSGSKSVTDPYLLSKSYLDLFLRRSGSFRVLDAGSIRPAGAGRWTVASNDSSRIHCRQVVIAAGPWSDDVCRRIGLKIPLAWERGYHANLHSPRVPLRRPVHDVQQGFVMTPQGDTTRVTSGVEFAHRDALPDYAQIRRAVAVARSVASLGETTHGEPWLGSRPTLPDGLPMIGPAGGHTGLWLSFGHQHIGLSTAAGSAVILADSMTGMRTSDIDAAPYSPARYGA